MNKAYKISTIEDTEKFLGEHDIPFHTVKHEATATVAEMLERVKISPNCVFAKNLFLKNKKTGGLYLLIAKHDTQTDMKVLGKYLKAGAGNLRQADEAALKDILGVEKVKFLRVKKQGSVNPFSILNDTENKVEMLVDKELLQNEKAAFHPMQNIATTEISLADFRKILELSKHEPRILDFTTLEAETEPKKEEAKDNKNKATKEESKHPAGEEEGKDSEIHKLGIEYKKEENFSKWYQQVIMKAGLVDYYEISGCYILKPWSYAIWESIMQLFDGLIKKNGVENAYFPLFVSKGALEKEEQHLAGFSPEVAWVTRSGSTELKEPIAIRPTSETIIHPCFSRWIKSHRDLPVKVNQWTNVVRWEFKHPTPFIRNREFLWQEGHTAHAKVEHADEQVYTILDYYEKVFTELLAVPVIKGKKSTTEKFAGAYYTTSCETFIPAVGRGIQGATSHNLGQNFSKMFDITFLDEKLEKQYAWLTSWGLSIRSIGVLIMTHGDNKGLALPPRVAKIQTVLIPILHKTDDTKVLLTKLVDIEKDLAKAGIRTKVDDRTNYNPGWKFNDWELKGVPIRIELGSKDLQKGEVRVVRRDTGEKVQMKWETLPQQISELLEQIQNDMYESAKKKMFEKITPTNSYDEFVSLLNKKHAVLTAWCEDAKCEEEVSEKSKVEAEKAKLEEEDVLTGSAKTLCLPLVQDPIQEGEKCFHCGKPAKIRALWGRSF